MTRPTKVIVGPDRASSGWSVVIDGSARAITRIVKKKVAVQIALDELARLGGGELEVRSLDGRVLDVRTIAVTSTAGPRSGHRP